MHRKKYQLITKLYGKQIFIVFNLLYTQYYDCIMLYILQWHETEEQQSIIPLSLSVVFLTDRIFMYAIFYDNICFIKHTETCLNHTPKKKKHFKSRVDV